MKNIAKQFRNESVTFEIATPSIDEGCWFNFDAVVNGETLRLGGLIEDAETANAQNEQAGIAGGLRQGVSYPNETVVGELRPYHGGECDADQQWKEFLSAIGIEDEDEQWELANEAAALLAEVEKEVFAAQ